ncbi:probable basic-leucine zipper transcription factor F [Eurosta solidaginis]|uniref:probable basic-leucine zipper transcription factor F n=1 Tax=Eurosta solidaginis TaxID=178769 RepID=UPI003530CB04
MSSLIDKRKRSREDDICDSTPLSKRINQLHLTNMDEPNQSMPELHFNNPPKQAAADQDYNVGQINSNGFNTDHLMNLHNNNNQIHHQQTQQQQQHMHLQHSTSTYAPELNEAENPFYYIKNKLLYELHYERLKRCVV